MLRKFIGLISELRKVPNFRWKQLITHDWVISVKGEEVEMTTYKFIRHLHKTKTHFKLEG